MTDSGYFGTLSPAPIIGCLCTQFLCVCSYRRHNHRRLEEVIVVVVAVVSVVGVGGVTASDDCQDHQL